MASPPRTLIEPGHEAEWARLNAEKRRALAPPSGTPVGDLLRRGQNLSAQAAGLLRAVERAGERPDPEITPEESRPSELVDEVARLAADPVDRPARERVAVDMDAVAADPPE